MRGYRQGAADACRECRRCSRTAQHAHKAAPIACRHRPYPRHRVSPGCEEAHYPRSVTDAGTGGCGNVKLIDFSNRGFIASRLRAGQETGANRAPAAATTTLFGAGLSSAAIRAAQTARRRRQRTAAGNSHCPPRFVGGSVRHGKPGSWWETRESAGHPGLGARSEIEPTNPGPAEWASDAEGGHVRLRGRRSVRSAHCEQQLDDHATQLIDASSSIRRPARTRPTSSSGS